MTGFIFGSTALYECDEGFKLVGNKQRNCQANELWSGKVPVCTRKQINYYISIHSKLSELLL